MNGREWILSLFSKGGGVSLETTLLQETNKGGGKSMPHAFLKSL